MQASPEVPARGALDRLVGRLCRACGVLAAVAVVAILAIVCIETVLRQFDASLQVTDEIAGYLNAAAIFLGLAWTLREGGFIRVELVYDRVAGNLKQALRWMIVLTATIFSALTLWICMRQVIYAFDRDTRAVSIIDTPEWIPQSVMVLGLAVLLLQLVAWIVDRVRHIP
jgi:TRAP-type C4-dicarboxylate transport system permease small subunit